MNRTRRLVLYEYKIPFFAATVFKHTLKVRSVVVRARHGSVDIGIENKNIILLSVFLANAQLSFDRLLRLVIAGIPCIDNENVTPLFFITVFNHTLEFVALIGCTRYCFINICINYEHIVSFGIFFTYA